MQATNSRRSPGLPPLVGTHVAVISQGLERAHDRARGLEEFGYRVFVSGDPAAGVLGTLASFHADAVVVDLGRELAFPGDVVTRVRQDTAVPVVVVGCAGTFAEMLRCYEAGADDYCRPRCPTEEIDVRLRAVFRRMEMAAPEVRGTTPPVMRVGAIEIDTASQQVSKDGVVIPLSPTEFRLLATLAERPGEVIPSKALIARVWGNQYAGETHYLRLYIRYLRQKLEENPSNPEYIVNRWGSGYTLEEPRQAAARAG